MLFKFIKPSTLLLPYIKHYCLMESVPGEIPVSERVIPTENMQLMFHYRKPFVVNIPGKPHITQPRSIVSGLSSTFSDVSTCGDTGVIFVTFHPAAACHFFNFSLAEIENQSINLADIYKNEIEQTEDILSQKKDHPQRIKVIEKWLLSRLKPIPHYNFRTVMGGIEQIKKNNGQLSSKELSQILSVTTKTLERRFSEYLGKSPRQYGKLIRFQNSILSYYHNKNLTLTECAHLNGYHDQSHFIRDFKMHSGYTPGDFFSLYGECLNEPEI